MMLRMSFVIKVSDQLSRSAKNYFMLLKLQILAIFTSKISILVVVLKLKIRQMAINLPKIFSLTTNLFLLIVLYKMKIDVRRIQSTPNLMPVFFLRTSLSW